MGFRLNKNVVGIEPGCGDFGLEERCGVSCCDLGLCGQKGIADRAAAIESGGMIPSFSQNSAQTTDVRGVFEDVVNEFANTADMSAQDAIAKIKQGLADI